MINPEGISTDTFSRETVFSEARSAGGGFQSVFTDIPPFGGIGRLDLRAGIG